MQSHLRSPLARACARTGLALFAGLALSSTGFAQTLAPAPTVKPATEHALAGDSLYQLGASLTDQNGRALPPPDVRDPEHERHPQAAAEQPRMG